MPRHSTTVDAFYHKLKLLQVNDNTDTRIYSAVKKETSEKVVLHILNTYKNSGLQAAVNIQRQLNPAQYAGNLILPKYLFYDQDKGHVLESAYVHGQFLEDFLDLHPDKWRKVLIQLSLTLAFLSELKIMHNDLHSGNILIKEHGTRDDSYPKFNLSLLDLGYSRKHTFAQDGFQVYIIDWDRAWAPGVSNLSLENHKNKFCKYFGQCNRFQFGYDLFTCLSNFKQNSEIWAKVSAILFASKYSNNLRELFRTKVWDSFQADIVKSQDSELIGAYRRLYEAHQGLYESHRIQITKDLELDRDIKDICTRLLQSPSKLRLELCEKATNHGYWLSIEKMHPWRGYGCRCWLTPWCDTCNVETNLSFLPYPADLYRILQKQHDAQNVLEYTP